MTKLSRIISVLAIFLFAAGAFALDIPPKPTAWVTDTGNILSPEEELALNEKLEAFARRSGSQFLVFTYPTLGEEALEDYTIRVAEQWKTRDDRALVIFVFVKERKLRIEVGQGLEPSVPDSIARRAIANDIAPHFRTGNYAAGLNAGVDSLIRRIEGREEAIPHDVPQPGSGFAARPLSCSEVVILIVILIFIFVVVMPALSRSGCVGCFPIFLPWGGGGTTFGSGRGGGWGGGGGWSVGGSWGGGGGGSFGGGGASGDW